MLALDGLRGVAILLVLIYHGTRQPGASIIDQVLTFWTYGGWIGVDLFFVLSGYLITGILVDTKSGPSYFKNFYARRFLRIFPLYYGVLFVLLVILPRIPLIQATFGSLAGDEIWYWVYLSNFSLGITYPTTPRRLDVFWSLAIEEQFYLVWPAIVLFLTRRRLMLLCVGVIVGAALLRLGGAATGLHAMTMYVVTPFRLDCLAVGAFIALAVREEGGVQRLLRWTRPVMLVSAVIVIGIVLWSGEFSPFTPGMQALGYSGLALFFGGLLVLSIGLPPRAGLVRLLERPALRSFGRYSYALYLFHVPIIVAMLSLVYRRDQFLAIGDSVLPGQLIFYVLSLAVPFVFAWLSWRLFETRFLELKRFFSYERRAAPPLQAPSGVPLSAPGAVGAAAPPPRQT